MMRHSKMHFSGFRFFSFVAVLILSSFSPSTMANELLDKLKRMSEVDENQNYQGVFIIRKADTLSTLSVTHGIDAKGDWESLEALNGEPRKVLRRNNQVVSVFPARELMVIRQSENNQSLHRHLPENIDKIEQFYTIRRLADDRIANHDTIVVDLVPTDKYRYGYRYWLDKNTGMLLRCDSMADDETIVEQIMFTSLNYLANSPIENFNLEQFEHFKQQVIMDAEADSTVVDSHGWTFNHLPKGFMLVRSNMRFSKPLLVNKKENAMTGTQNKLHQKPVSSLQVASSQSAPIQPIHMQPDLLHLVYSDGLASVSVFIKKSLEEERHYEGVSSMGAINAFGNFIDDYFVTAVGVVPVNTVKLMAQSAVKSLNSWSEQ